jgi:hypothetical protein
VGCGRVREWQPGRPLFGYFGYFGYRGLKPEIPEINLGFRICHPKMLFGLRDSGFSVSGSGFLGFGLRVRFLCP